MGDRLDRTPGIALVVATVGFFDQIDSSPLRLDILVPAVFVVPYLNFQEIGVLLFRVL